MEALPVEIKGQVCVYVCTDAVSTGRYQWKNARMLSCSVGFVLFNQTTSHKEVNDLANFIKQIACISIC